MAPGRLSKRPRALTDEFESIASDARLGEKARGKRPRRSETPDSDAESRSRGSSNTQSDAEVEEDEDDIDPRATQRVTNQLREQKQNTPAENGIIEEIRCTNFMCHEQLTVTLGPLINFVIGHNGSGKSAVLTALTLCLGGKPGSTNRGNNLKGFIKEGKDYCILSVRIKNQGSSAFKPDTYGRSIIVERHFSKTSSGFKIKDENGRIVSQKKQELEDIIDAFALQIDNPMNVLTQDMARQFLNDSTPKDKYKFFLKGTQLETLSKDYELIKSQLDEIEGKIGTASADIDILRRRAQDAISKAKRASNLSKMRDREAALRNQAAWAKVQEEEAELDEVISEIDRVREKIEERNAEVEARSHQFDIANEAFSNANKDIEDRQAEIVPLEEERAQLKAKMDEVKKALFAIHSTQRRVGSLIQSKENSIKSYEAQIQETRRRQEEADNGQYAQKVRELEEAKVESDKAKQQLAEHNDGSQALNDQIRTAQENKKSADAKVELQRSEVRRAQRIIGELEHGRGSWMDAYKDPKCLQRLLNYIQKERQFRQAPIGPMGRYIKLLEPAWSSLLEKSSGASLNAFVVTSTADQTLLTKLMRNAKYSAPIYIGQGTPIDTTGNEPEAQLTTWLKVLKFDNDLVRNQMIIHHTIDQVVLMKEREEAENFMHDGGGRRKNVKLCLAMADGDPQKGHSVTFNAQTGAIALGPISRYEGLARMQADKESQLNAAKENLQRLQTDLRSAEAEGRQLQTHVVAAQRNIDDHKKRKQELTLQQQRAQSNVESLEDDLNAATPDAGLIDQLEESLQTAQEEKTFEEGQYQDTVLEKDELDAKNKESLRLINQLVGRIDQMRIQIGKATKKADLMKNKRDEELRAKNAAFDKAKAAEDNKGEWEHKRGEKLAIVEDLRQQAEAICPRVPVPEGATFESLIKTRERLMSEREKAQNELGGSEDDLIHLANIAKRAHQEAYDAMAKHREISKWLKRSLVNRQSRWMKFRQNICLRARITFSYLLSDRQFRGTLRVDHKAKHLDIHVQPDITVAGEAGRQTKTLSGGEKSFSTICLLLSLWEAMGSPIRCLDEFDVFMDSVNRDISMKMMIGAARRSIGRQYILITPQAMNSVQSVGDVKIIKMQDPERGQTALNITR